MLTAGACATYDPRRKGGLPDKKDADTDHKFCKETLRDTKILFCGCGLNFYHPYNRYQLVT